MRPGPSDAQARGNLRRRPRASSWLGTRLLAEQVPVEQATLEESDTQAVPEKLTLTVPVRAAGGPWDPATDPSHPLACFGQRLFVAVDWWTPGGASGATDLGWFQTQEWDVDDDTGVVTVTAHGLLQAVDDDKLPAPTQPSIGATFASEVRRLVPGGLPVSISPDLVDRPVPAGFTWEEDRLGAILDLVDAWPARMTVAATGTLVVAPPLGVVPDPVLTLTDGDGGVLISLPRSDSRAGRYTTVVATSSKDTTDSAPVSGEWAATAGPYAPAVYGTVRRRVSSPLLGTQAAAQEMARTVAESSQRQARILTVAMPPDVRIERGDALRLRWGADTYDGWVQQVSWPVHVPSAATPMTLKVVCPL